MKFSKEYKRIGLYSNFFRSVNYSNAFCIEFTEHYFRREVDFLGIKVTFSKTNPKKKGFREVKRVGLFYVKIGEYSHDILSYHRTFLDEQNVKIGDSFWIKIEEIA
jgi:hypothetical protein